MGLIILLSVWGNIRQSDKNRAFKDNDLKYRYIIMQGEATPDDISNLQSVFNFNRDNESIKMIRKRVEQYERLVREQSEKITRARLNANEAERLRQEIEEVKK